MKKRWLVLLLTLAMLLLVVQVGVLADETAESGSAAAETTAAGSCGENVTWTLENGTLTISGTGDMDNYIWYGSAPWYDYQDFIDTAVISDGVTSIGDEAFRDCGALTCVTIPDSVTRIGDSAFQYTALTEVTIPDSVTDLGAWVFFSCKSLKNVTIGNQVTSIGDHAFYDCSALNGVAFPDSVTSIGYVAFANCTNLKSASFGNGLTNIYEKAFVGCSSLESVTLPDNVTGMGYGAFMYCTALKSVTIGNGITTVGPAAFEGCTSLAIVKIGGSVTAIGHYAFGDCTSLTSITIPDGVTTINDFAFQNCTGLQRVTIPVSVASINEDAFKGCTNLVDIYYAGTADTWNAINIDDGNDVLNFADINCWDTPPADSPFIDVQDSSAYYYEPVLWAAENGIVYGTGEYEFSPEEGCTRAQVITFLYRAAGEPEVFGKMYFNDVDPDAYYYDAVLWGYHNGIVYGTQTRTFDPDELVTRAQFLTFLHRYAVVPQPTGTTSPFKDVPADEYYTHAVLWGYENGIVYGTSETTFSPDDTCTRAQVVTFLHRYMAEN